MALLMVDQTIEIAEKKQMLENMLSKSVGINMKNANQLKLGKV